ncbi:hypothetical protein RB195_000402 [Necator americanus]|uniref:Neurotransmitter-gated ion-channel ligand-binding domain-containing protein n=1 Tax=Necator americanus TaxID=51031 RepID=A0ABR1DA26_NECAM
MLRVTVFWLALIPNYALTSCPFVDRDDYLHEQARLYKALLKDYDPRLSAVSMQTLNSSVELNPGLPRYEAWITLVFMKMIQVVRDFPFDHQECYIKTMAQSFSAWEYRIRAVLKNTLFENSSAIEDMGNGEWQIKNVSVKSKFADNGDEYATEMLGIALTNLMSLTFILGILATALPKTKDLPRIAIFVMLNLCIMVLALVTTLLLTHFKHYIDGDPEVADSTGEKRKRKDGKLFRLAHIGSFVLLEIANLVNFIILVV